MKSTSKSLAVLAAVLVVVACADCTAPTPRPKDAVRMTITPAMRAQWDTLESCSKRLGTLDRVAFYTTEDLPAQVVGMRRAAGDTLEVFLRPFYATSERVLKHEMMHALLASTSGHPEQYFRQLCGDLMYEGAN